MSTQNLFETLTEEMGNSLMGDLKFNGDVIKYEYDSFQTNNDEQDLEDICFADRSHIEDFLENQDEFFTTEPETHDTIIYFYIER